MRIRHSPGGVSKRPPSGGLFCYKVLMLINRPFTASSLTHWDQSATIYLIYEKHGRQFMKHTVGRLLVLHAAVLVLAAVVAVFVWGLGTSLATVVGALAFSVPVVVFSLLVLRASQGEKSRFWRRFMVAEVLKWASAAALLSLAFLTFRGQAQPLLAGFLISVLVQVIFPIFVQRESKV
jgi:F0F1-type ATP synthase assembly protein I